MVPAAPLLLIEELEGDVLEEALPDVSAPVEDVALPVVPDVLPVVPDVLPLVPYELPLDEPIIAFVSVHAPLVPCRHPVRVMLLDEPVLL